MKILTFVFANLAFVDEHSHGFLCLYHTILTTFVL